MELTKTTAPAHGGIRCEKIRIIHPSKIVHADIANGAYLDEHTTSEGGWGDFYFIKDTASFNEEPEIIDGAEFFRQEIQCLIQGDSSYQMSQLSKIKKRKLHIMFTDANGNKKIMAGTKDSFATMIVGSRSTKATRPERREVAVLFTCLSKYRAAAYPF